jgi:hypothetical protein
MGTLILPESCTFRHFYPFVTYPCKINGVKVYDTNSSNYLNETERGWLLHVDDGYDLNSNGTEFVKQILADIEEASVPGGFVYWKGSNKPGQKRQKTSREEEQQVSQWLEAKLNIGKLDIRDLETPKNYAMFALWALTKGISVVPAVKPKLAYLYITKKFTTISVNERPFRDALSRSSNRNTFNKNADGLYYLTSQAEREVEAWMQFGAVEQVVASEVEENGEDIEE